MKNLIFYLFLFATINCFAQQTEGTIYYTESIKLDIELPEGQEHLKAMIPTSSDQTKALYFTPSKSMYKDLDGNDGNTEINHESEGTEMQINIVSGSSDNKLLKDFDTKEMIDQRDFLGKKFLITGEIAEMDWKITGQQKKILDFVCQEATTSNEEEIITAWFAPQIPLSNGPDAYGQLPGMILEVSMEDGKRTIVATKIEFGTVAEELLVTPKKGKKITREGFQKVQEEKLKEMGGGTSRTVIRMEVDDRG